MDTVGYLLQSTSCYNPLSVIIQLKTELGKGVPLVFSLKMAFQNMSPVTIHWIVTGSPLYFVVLELEHLIATEPTQFRVFGDVHHRPQWRHCPLRAGMLW